MSLAVTLHHANHSADSVVLLHASLEVTKDPFMHHVVLGHIYKVLGRGGAGAPLLLHEVWRGSADPTALPRELKHQDGRPQRQRQ